MFFSHRQKLNANVMIEAIIFDFGNVICTFDRNRFLQHLVPYGKKTIRELEEAMYSEDDFDQFEKGHLTGKEWYLLVTQKGELTLPYDYFVAAYVDIFTPIEKTHELIKKLKPNYKLALLSNTNEIHYEQYIQKTDIFPLFDAVTVSHKVHALKPDEEIFRDCLEKVSVNPTKCIYIDDIAEYVAAGSALWLHAHHYQTHEKLMRFLQEWGIHV